MILSQKIHEIRFWTRKNSSTKICLEIITWFLHAEFTFLNFTCLRFSFWLFWGMKSFGSEKHQKTDLGTWDCSLIPWVPLHHCRHHESNPIRWVRPQLSSCPKDCIFQSLTGLTFVSLQDNYWDGVFQRQLLDQVGNTDFHTEFQGSSIGKWRLFTPSEAWNPLMTRLFWLEFRPCFWGAFSGLKIEEKKPSFKQTGSR